MAKKFNGKNYSCRRRKRGRNLISRVIGTVWRSLASSTNLTTKAWSRTRSLFCIWYRCPSWYYSQGTWRFFCNIGEGTPTFILFLWIQRETFMLPGEILHYWSTFVWNKGHPLLPIVLRQSELLCVILWASGTHALAHCHWVFFHSRDHIPPLGTHQSQPVSSSTGLPGKYPMCHMADSTSEKIYIHCDHVFCLLTLFLPPSSLQIKNLPYLFFFSFGPSTATSMPFHILSLRGLQWCTAFLAQLFQ